MEFELKMLRAALIISVRLEVAFQSLTRDLQVVLTVLRV